MDAFVLHKAPPLDPAWLQKERDAGLHGPQPVFASPLERQPVYAARCREINSAMMTPGARDQHLSHGVAIRPFTVPSSADGFPIPVLQYDLSTPPPADGTAKTVIVYIHGGGLLVGEADSEDLSCRRIIKDGGLPNPTLYSVGYRLMPANPASTCVSDCLDAFAAVLALHPGAEPLLVGSSSGGQLAATVSQTAPGRSSIRGIVLRCPVTSDAFSGMQLVPERLQALHTSAWEPSFVTVLGGVMRRAEPRDGLARMPLEATEEELRGLPRTWIQVCTNDTLYSDGLCYAKALEDAGVEVKLDVVTGWPHTFWLKFPEMQRALEADEAMLKGLAWVAE